MIEVYVTTGIAAVVTAFAFIAWLMVRSRKNTSASRGAQETWTRQDGQMLKLMEAGNLVLTQYSASGRLEYISPEIKRITGIGSADFISGRRRLNELVHPQDAAALESLERTRSNGDGEHADIDCRIQDQRNNWHWLHIQQRRIVRRNKTVGYETISVDYTALAELKAQKKRATKLQKMSTLILESFLATDDTRATLNRNLERIAKELEITEATIHDFENSDGCSLLGSWPDTDRTSSRLTHRPLTASESEQIRAACQVLTPIRFGMESGHSGDNTRPLCRDAASLTGSHRTGAGHRRTLPRADLRQRSTQTMACRRDLGAPVDRTIDFAQTREGARRPGKNAFRRDHTWARTFRNHRPSCLGNRA